MPTYEYECTKCGHTFERFQNMTDEPLKRCPKCRCKIRRVFGTGAGIIFKGSGFYETDYKRSGYQKDAEKETKKAEKKDSGAASTKDKKPVKKD